jgi:hypothetical protein
MLRSCYGLLPIFAIKETRALDKRSYDRERRRLDIARRKEELRRSAWDRWRRTVVLPGLAAALGGIGHDWLARLVHAIFGG